MGGQIKKKNTEEQLIQARSKGLERAREVHSMQAHGKVDGMDTFSWINPNVDALSTVILSFPFPVYWVGKHEQMKKCIDLYPEVADNIRGLIVYDSGLINVDREILELINNVLCVNEIEDALHVFQSMQEPKTVFLFTTDHEESDNQKASFNEFILNRK